MSDAMQMKIERYTKSTSSQETVKLSEIDVHEEAYCHRTDAKADLEGLAESMAQEGQQTPMVVIKKGGRYHLVAGHRRYYALKRAIEDKLPGCCEDMDVTVTIMVPGQDQSAQEFDHDVLVRSVADNTNRVDFDEFEKLKITKLFEARGVQAKRGMAALDVKESQYRRWTQIVKTEWLFMAVLAGDITATNAAKLVDAAASDCTEEEAKERMELLRREFAQWRVDAQKQLDAENESRLKKQKEPKEGKDAYLKRYADPQLIRGWERCLKKGMPFDRVREFRYGIETDAKKLTLEIPALKLKSEDLSEVKLRMVIAGFEDGIDALYALLAAIRRQQPISKAEVEALKAGLREDQRGQDAADFDDTEESNTTDVSAEIEQQWDDQDGSDSTGDDD